MRAVVVLLVVSVAVPAWGDRPAAATARKAQAGSAAEEAVPESCDVPPSIFPANGARNVPRNARAWITAGLLGDYRLRSGTTERRLKPITHAPFRIIELPLGELAANTTYSLVYGEDVLSSFTTGADRDMTPPHPPLLIGADAVRARDTALTLLLTSSREAAMMKLTVHSARGHVTLIAPEQTLRSFIAECAGIELRVEDNVCFDAAELDAVGNRSAAVRRCTTVEHYRYRDHRAHDFEDYARENVPAVVFLVLLACFTAGGLLLLGRSAAREGFKSPLEPFDAELARRIALRQRRSAAAMFALCLPAVVLVAGVLHPNVAATLGAVPLTMAIVTAVNGRRLHRLLAAVRAGAPTHYDGRNHVFVDSRKWLAVSAGQLRRVLKAGVPVAKVR